MANANNNLPKTFEGALIDIHSQPNFARCVDWIMFILHIIPTYVIEQLNFQQSNSKQSKKSPHIFNKSKEALLALSSAASLILEFQISEEKIQKITRFLRDEMPVNAFTISQHYLSHVPDIIRQLGPPRLYSTRTMERQIGVVKPRIKSRSKPAANASNVIHQIQTKSYFKRNQKTFDDDAQVDDITSDKDPLSVTVGDAPITISKLYNGSLDQFSKLGLKALLVAYYSRHKIPITDSCLDNRIRFARKAEVRGHLFKGMASEDDEESVTTFAKASLTVDRNANMGYNSQDVTSYGTYFGNTLLFFRHTQNGTTRILCLLNVYLDTKPSVGGGVPSGTSHDTRLHVTEITHLDCAAHKLQYLHNTNKDYYIYQGMVRDDIILGERRKI
ncbi:hypothetical protein BJV82DRAFT_584940 [Fennellomyces sp. T-0311]|nr:hypothetical protein BJV82DRAFT_584940 [Fennellomyces sp. T-0311]